MKGNDYQHKQKENLATVQARQIVIKEEDNSLVMLVCCGQARDMHSHNYLLSIMLGYVTIIYVNVYTLLICHQICYVLS